MRIVKTNAALAYKEYAYLLQLDTEITEHQLAADIKHDYLCIGKNCKTDSYMVGEKICDLEEYYVEPTTYKLEDSPLPKFLLLLAVKEERINTLLTDMKFYIERSEVRIDSEWGCNREIEDLIKDKAMPDVYNEVIKLIGE